MGSKNLSELSFPLQIAFCPDDMIFNENMDTTRDWLDGYDFTAELKLIEKNARKSKQQKQKQKQEIMGSNDKEGSDEEAEGASEAVSNKALLDFQMKHRTARSKWTVPESFPDALIAAAYLQPKASYNAEKFEWLLPDVGKVRAYCRDTFGWSDAQVTCCIRLLLATLIAESLKMDALVDPAIKNFSNRSIQVSLLKLLWNLFAEIPIAWTESNRRPFPDLQGRSAIREDQQQSIAKRCRANYRQTNQLNIVS